MSNGRVNWGPEDTIGINGRVNWGPEDTIGINDTVNWGPEDTIGINGTVCHEQGDKDLHTLFKFSAGFGLCVIFLGICANTLQENDQENNTGDVNLSDGQCAFFTFLFINFSFLFLTNYILPTVLYSISKDPSGKYQIYDDSNHTIVVNIFYCEANVSSLYNNNTITEKHLVEIDDDTFFCIKWVCIGLPVFLPVLLWYRSDLEKGFNKLMCPSNRSDGRRVNRGPEEGHPSYGSIPAGSDGASHSERNSWCCFGRVQSSSNGGRLPAV